MKILNKRTWLTGLLVMFGLNLAIPVSARFLAKDPKADKYPTISPYVYVSNSPLRKVDPNGAEEFDVVVDVYIPYETVGPFLGDNRGPSMSPDRSSRIQHNATVETDPNISSNPLISHDAQIGPTIMLLPTSPYVAVGQASSDQITSSANRSSANGGDNTTLSMNGSAANPLVPGAPAIDYQFQISIVPGQAPNVSVKGSHDGFPAYTITVVNKDGKVAGTYQYTPSSKSDVRKLFDDFYGQEKVDE